MIVPSLNDAHHFYPYPQVPLESRREKDPRVINMINFIAKDKLVQTFKQSFSSSFEQWFESRNDLSWLFVRCH